MDEGDPSAPDGRLVPAPADGVSLVTRPPRDAAFAATLGPEASAGADDAGRLGADALVRPARIGRFAILDVLGQGGMGRVYAAYDPDLDRRIALKVLLGDAERPAQTLRIRREAHAMARLSHPNVCPVFDVGEHAGQTWIAMEYVAGETLGRWQAGGRTPSEVLAMYAGVGAGLAAAHDAGMLHRDFKPDNVLVGADGRPRIIDFGLARGEPEPAVSTRAEARGDEGEPDLLAAELTGAGSVLGTPAYMAPEQLDGGPLDARCDQFAFCVALYEAVYGRSPFERRSLVARFESIARGPAPPPPSDVPQRIHRAIERGLAADPGDRWASMGALVEVLAADPGADRGVGVGVRLLIGALMVIGTLTVNRALGPGLRSGETSLGALMAGELALIAVMLGVGWRLRHRLLTTATTGAWPRCSWPWWAPSC